ncbi:MAG TPA: PHP domain-containing protein, partial [Acidimicrobiales bacterium]
MGWNNPPVPWAEFERRLSGRPKNADRGDSPAGPERPRAENWSRKRAPYQPPPAARRRVTTPYAELHCHTNFSFLDGASPPEELVEEAARLSLTALAVTDHDGMYGVVRFAEAAAALGVPTVFGAELTLDLPRRSQAGAADPAGRHLVVLARDPVGYARLCRAISTAHIAGGEKGLPKIGLAELATIGAACGVPPNPNEPVTLSGVISRKVSPVRGGVGGAGHWQVLTGCRKGTVPAALVEHGPAVAARELDLLVGAFGHDNVAVEIWDHGDPLDSARNDALVALALRAGTEVVATNNVHDGAP